MCVRFFTKLRLINDRSPVTLFSAINFGPNEIKTLFHSRPPGHKFNPSTRDGDFGGSPGRAQRIIHTTFIKPSQKQEGCVLTCLRLRMYVCSHMYTRAHMCVLVCVCVCVSLCLCFYLFALFFMSSFFFSEKKTSGS